MPTNKDLKRVVRRRMQKTGESYTSARTNLLKKKQEPLPDEYARLAGMSDEAVKAKTGCAWDRWVVALDMAKASEMTHREIASHSTPLPSSGALRRRKGVLDADPGVCPPLPHENPRWGRVEEVGR